jgi:DUF2971 family protein
MSSPGIPPSITDEQLQLAIRLDGIFMPHGRAKRDEAYKDESKPLRFVHYTSAEAALKIINSKRIWLRNTNCMSDYREVQHGFDLLNTYFLDREKREEFYPALNQCGSDIGEEAVSKLNHVLNDTRLNTFIACLSEHKDSEDFEGRLSMWRAVSASASRVAIVLRIPKYSGAANSLNVMFSPVAYMTEPEVHTEMKKIIQNINGNVEFLKTIDRNILVAVVFTMLVAGIASLKHKGFEEEKEWRAIYFPNRRPSTLIESSIEILNGVPQIVHKLPLDKRVSPMLEELDGANIFDRLIIGPSPYPWPMYTAFVEALKGNGIPDADKRVWVSKIPIR